MNKCVDCNTQVDDRSLCDECYQKRLIAKLDED